MKVITFYSDPPGSDYYSKHAKSWVSNVESYNLDYHIEKLSPNKYWENTRRKPQYILDCLEKFKETVLWVDVDTVFKSYVPYKSHPFITLARQDFPGRMYSSCLHFEYCEKSLELIKIWNELCCNDNNKQGDHHYLYKALDKSDIDTNWFPQDFWDIKSQPFSPFGGSIH
tara:strand:- start:940 stop:1449 length:510 start_codon:yes stop_codon:yes gene_type:complete